MPHFVIIHDTGIIEDYSLDEEKSPKISSYAQFPKSGREACALFYPETMKLIMRYKRSKELMEWKFDDQTPLYTSEDTWDNDQNGRKHGLCATSPSGKLFLYSGDLNSNLIFFSLICSIMFFNYSVV